MYPAIVLAVVLLAGIVIAASPTFRDCVAHPHQQEHKGSGQGEQQPTHTRGFLCLRCAVLTVEKNNTVITAFTAIAIAAFTGFLVLVSGGQVRVAKLAAEAAKDSAEAARDNLIKTFRPKIRVRKVSAKEVSKGTPRVPCLDVSFSIVNVGDSEATIQEAFAGLWWDARKPAVFPDELPPPVIVRKPDMAPGVANVVTVPTNERGARFLVKRLEKERLYFWGAIRYTDAQHRIRETAFCRRYNPTSKRFIAVEDPDFEHED